MRITHHVRRALIAAGAALALVAGSALAAAPASAAPPLPTKMAALGDSITQAAMTCSALTSCPSNSWSTGTTASIGSHYTKLKAAGAASLVAYNDAVSGAASSALLGQAQKAVAQGAQYVTIEIGANDACTSTLAGMTATATFRSNVAAALAALAASPAAPEIFVASIPNIQRMYDLNKGSATARLVWAIFGTCKSMLAKPTSTAAADVSRRAAVQARVDEYNAALASVCASTAKCRWDGGALAAYQFTKSDISTSDYFHPSTTGQKTLATVTWAKTQWTS